MNKSLQSKNSICAWAFRKGKEACEASFEPDMDLAYEMYDRKVRIQDVLDYFLIGEVGSDIRAFMEWYQFTHLRPASPSPASPSPPGNTQ